MATTAHVTNTFGATAPAGGYANESSRESSVQKYHVLDASGKKVRLRTGKHVVTEVSLLGKGAADYSVVAAGAFTGGAFKATSADTTEHNSGEYCDFNLSGKIHDNLEDDGGSEGGPD